MLQELATIDNNIISLLEEIAFNPDLKKEPESLSFSWIDEEYVETEEGVLLKVYKISNSSSSSINVVVIPGLSSHFYGWLVTDYVLSHVANVYHVETREKSSAIYKKKSISYTLEVFARDLFAIVRRYNLDKNGFYCLGDSFGAEIIIKYLDLGFTPPKGLILISPVKRFSFSLWMRIVISLLPHWLLKPFFPFVKFVLRSFRTHPQDLDTYYLNRRNIAKGNSRRMKYCALELTKYASDAQYSKISCPTYIIAASTDKMHDFNQSLEIAHSIPNTIFEDVVLFSLTHKKDVAEKIAKFIISVENKNLEEFRKIASS